MLLISILINVFNTSVKCGEIHYAKKDCQNKIYGCYKHAFSGVYHPSLEAECEKLNKKCRKLVDDLKIKKILELLKPIKGLVGKGTTSPGLEIVH